MVHRYRDIKFSIGDTCYSIAFRTAPFWRVKDVKVYSRKGPGYLYHLDKSVKIEPQNVSAVQALKDICGSGVESFALRLRQRFRHW